eukprot:CAMPEP_0181185256 /NCGR_PEP_ID=MMETSP1096-20121128/9409_1 /TAXON_ID=156174 ORGANISM="Chrysochromulina ericina, Strain CCMP281" /NCGR_SAMPLE_ID=MMETSP1096 /ASSEMBLY_ACC=CAM_ASM_000453 /LENGTH=165 /DNA_ID=CAMNT_0023274085 /DNA_START=242 /DNA_END=735 /DNA_ORIENTATION=-
MAPDGFGPQPGVSETECRAAALAAVGDMAGDVSTTPYVAAAPAEPSLGPAPSQAAQCARHNHTIKLQSSCNQAAIKLQSSFYGASMDQGLLPSHSDTVAHAHAGDGMGSHPIHVPIEFNSSRSDPSLRSRPPTHQHSDHTHSPRSPRSLTALPQPSLTQDPLSAT